jgi:hypothetical protein
MERGIERIAATYMQVCRETYTRWEAFAVVTHLG